MRWRATLAALIAALLLSVSFSAGACEITCELAMHISPCHQAAGEMAGAAARHQCAGTMQTGAEVMAVQDHCTLAVCAALPSALAADRTWLVLPERVGSVLPAVQPGMAALRAVAPSQHPAAHFAAAPPLRAPLVVSLQTTIRI
jgi:hypothetical protein